MCDGCERSNRRGAIQSDVLLDDQVHASIFLPAFAVVFEAERTVFPIARR